jgi:aspartate aminotransferase-like enzyme
MGHSCRRDNVMLCLSALGRIISETDTSIDASTGSQAAENVYTST